MKKILLLIICIILSANKIYAANGSFTDIWSDSGSGTGTPSDPNPGGIDGRGSTGYQPYTNNDKLYKCYYKHSVTVGTSLDINAYDMDGKSLLPTVLNTSETFPAGTWIGINATEQKYANWNIVNFKDFEIKKKYRCHYSYGGTATPKCSNNWESSCENGQYCFTKKECNSGLLEMSFILRDETPGCKTLYKCKIGTTYVGGFEKWGEEIKVNQNKKITINDCPKYNGIEADNFEILEENIEEEISPIADCRNDAVKEIKKQAERSVGKASNKLEFETSNKYDESNKLQIDAKGKYDKVQTEIKSERREYNYYVSANGRAWQDYEYMPEKVCINLTTSEVKYNGECNNTSMKIIENSTTYDEYLKKNISYWKYFIPLDTTTNSKISLNMIANTAKDSQGRLIPTLTEKQCLNGMKNKPNDYVYYIKPLEGNFEGDYTKGENKSNDIKKVKKDNGCLITITLNFNIVQKFYGEEKKSGYTTLKGYGMYFRQIAINNPFPSGIDNSIYWNGFDVTKLKSSFDKPTYVATINNNAVNKIKEFNNKYSYTDWTGNASNDTPSGMKSEGTSRFISNNTGEIFKKYSANFTNNSPYKLGCGPANYDTWSWCKSWNGHSHP